MTTTSDGLTETQQLSCGMKLNLKYDLDSEYKFKYTKESTKTSPAGLAQTTSLSKTYQDTNADKKPDQEGSRGQVFNLDIVLLGKGKSQKARPELPI